MTTWNDPFPHYLVSRCLKLLDRQQEGCWSIVVFAQKIIVSSRTSSCNAQKKSNHSAKSWVTITCPCLDEWYCPTYPPLVALTLGAAASDEYMRTCCEEMRGVKRKREFILCLYQKSLPSCQRSECALHVKSYCWECVNIWSGNNNNKEQWANVKNIDSLSRAL